MLNLVHCQVALHCSGSGRHFFFVMVIVCVCVCTRIATMFNHLIEATIVQLLMYSLLVKSNVIKQGKERRKEVIFLMLA